MLPLSSPLQAPIDVVNMKRSASSPYSLDFIMAGEPASSSSAASSSTTPRTHAQVHPYARPSSSGTRESYSSRSTSTPSVQRGYNLRHDEASLAASSMASQGFPVSLYSSTPATEYRVRSLYGRKRNRSPSPQARVLEDHARLYSSALPGPTERRLSGESSTTMLSSSSNSEADYHAGHGASRSYSNSLSEPISAKRSKPGSPTLTEPASPSGCDHCGHTAVLPRTRDQPLTPEDHAHCFEEMFKWFRALVPRNGQSQYEFLETGCKLEGTLYRYPPQTKAELLAADIEALRVIIVDWLRTGAKGRIADLSGGITSRDQKIAIVEKIWALYKGLESPGGGGANTPDWRGMAKTLNLAMGKDQGSKTGNERLRQMMDQRIKHLLRELRRTD